MDTIEYEIIKTRIEIAQLKRKLIHTENNALRMRIKANVHRKRQLAKLIKLLGDKIQPSLFKTEESSNEQEHDRT